MTHVSRRFRAFNPLVGRPQAMDRQGPNGRRGSSPLPLRCIGVAVVLLLFLPGYGRAQSKSAPDARAARSSMVRAWAVDPAVSLAWWQMDPHMGHLWATTCPEDPSWSPGESRSSGWSDRQRKEVPVTMVYDGRIPMYPRTTVRPGCTPAVSGEITASDTVAWSDARGTIAVDMEALITGLSFRDRYARMAVYQSAEYGPARFTIERLDAVRAAGDTIRADAVGTFELRGVAESMTVPIVAWHEAGGLRVEGQFAIPAPELTGKFHVSKLALGMGVGQKLWKTLHMGFDLILRRGDE